MDVNMSRLHAAESALYSKLCEAATLFTVASAAEASLSEHQKEIYELAWRLKSEMSLSWSKEAENIVWRL